MPFDFRQSDLHPCLKLGEPFRVCDSLVASDCRELLPQTFDRLIMLMETDECFRSLFNDIAGELNEDLETTQFMGGFYKNKFQNREDQLGHDDKVVWQVSRECLDHFELALAMAGYRSDPVYGAVLLAQQLLEEGARMMRPTIAHLCRCFPELASRLLEHWQGEPLSLRFMRYREHRKMATDPHVDKTVLSTILWNSDANEEQRLVFPLSAPGEAGPHQYQAIGCRPAGQLPPAYIFWGAALWEAGYCQHATPHAVLPVNGEAYRYSVAVFWHLPDLDLAAFSTRVPNQMTHVPCAA